MSDWPCNITTTLIPIEIARTNAGRCVPGRLRGCVHPGSPCSMAFRTLFAPDSTSYALATRARRSTGPALRSVPSGSIYGSPHKSSGFKAIARQIPMVPVRPGPAARCVRATVRPAVWHGSLDLADISSTYHSVLDVPRTASATSARFQCPGSALRCRPAHEELPVAHMSCPPGHPQTKPAMTDPPPLGACTVSQVAARRDKLARHPSFGDRPTTPCSFHICIH
nr:hypothetical protein CFP56_32212 [Quercus suber]